MFSLFLLAWQACALHNPTHDNVSPNVSPDDGAAGIMLEVHDGEGVQGNASSFSEHPIANGLAGCKSGNFAAKGANKCTGIQGLRCNEDGGCVGTLQGNVYKINCNTKHECVTESWGGTMVRKYLSTTGHTGIVDWNNGCSWICEEEESTLARTTACQGDLSDICHKNWCAEVVFGPTEASSLNDDQKNTRCAKYWSITSLKQAQNCHWSAAKSSCQNYVTGADAVGMASCPDAAITRAAVATQCSAGTEACVAFNVNGKVKCGNAGVTVPTKCECSR